MTRYANLRDELPTRVLVCGDWHANTQHAKAAINFAHTVGADAIIHVGDLMWGWHGQNPRTFSTQIEDELVKRDIFMIWADGNHENHALIRSFPVRADGFVQTGESGHLFWSPRANRWNWWGHEFATVGGAYSINREDFTEGEGVFSDLEEVKREDVDLLGHDKVDVLITHDVPAEGFVRKQFKLEPWRERRSFESRLLLREAVENTRPDLVFSGHWHQRVTSTITRDSDAGDTTVHVLHQDGFDANAVILDLPDLELIEGADRPGWHQWTRRAEKIARSRAAREEYRNRYTT